MHKCQASKPISYNMVIHILSKHLLDAFIILHPWDESVTLNNLLKLFLLIHSYFFNWWLLFPIFLAWNTQNMRSTIQCIFSDFHDENHNVAVSEVFFWWSLYCPTFPTGFKMCHITLPCEKHSVLWLTVRLKTRLDKHEKTAAKHNVSW